LSAVRNLIDFADAAIFAIPVVDERTGNCGIREGMLIEGPQGWGEFSPLRDFGEREVARCLTAAIEVGTVGWPDAVRGRVPVSAAIPAVDAAVARRMAIDAGCMTADVAVAESRDSQAGDIARLEAVRDALGPHGKVRCDVHGSWDVDTALSTIPLLDKAAGGLQYVEQPCASLTDVAAVRRALGVRIAVDESIRYAPDPLQDSLDMLREAADVIVLKCGPLGGVRRASRVAEMCGLPAVVSSTTETTIGLSAGLALAGSLQELPFACGLGTMTLLSGDVVAGPRSLVPLEGYLPVAPMPPTPDPELVAKYRVINPAEISWWRTRLRTLTDPGPTPPLAP
jgi:O-succinylbenzoate synthase